MIWLTWRQFRTQAWFALGFLAVAAAVLAVTGPTVADLARTTGFAGCTADCGGLADAFLSRARNGTTGTLYWGGIGVTFVVPALLGVFWGAPLVARELEAGTHRLAWTQSITRTRWLAVKLLGAGLAAMAVTGLLSLAITWWTATLDRAGLNRMFPEIFAARGVVPVGYAAFAFLVGVTAGMLLRRTVPAMAVTLAVVVAAQIVTPFWVRPHLTTPVHTTAPLDVSALRSLMLDDGRGIALYGEVQVPGAWVLSNETITSTGAVYTGPVDPAFCGRDAPPRACPAWLDTQGLRQDVRYVPADRFWTLQWYETGLFLGLAVLLGGFCFWWIRRRLT